MLRNVHDPPAAPSFEDGAVRGGWFRELDASGQILCELCPRACKLKPGDRGFCFVRENRGGEMALTTYGRSTGFCIDPIEKKPLNHFLPGTSVLSFGTAGCNLGCRFCQNWDISKSREVERLSEEAGPAAIALAAQDHGCRSVAFTYNDPVIWAEYAMDVSKACHEHDIRTVAVTAGYLMPEAREAFFRGIDAANVDLKAFSESFYHEVTASHLQPVLDTLVYLKRETDVWFEITNLLIPDANDSADELQRMCEWIVKELGVDVPVHFTAFHPDFRMQDRGRTPHETLLRGYEIAQQHGIRYVYLGNVHDDQRQNTYCPTCGQLLIQRRWHEVGAYRLSNGCCIDCGASIAGRFESAPGTWGQRRLPIVIRDYGSEAAQPGKESKMTDACNTPLELNDQQRRAISVGALRIMESAIRGEPAEAVDVGELGGVGELVVDGVFTTLKRGDALRGCCGALGQPMPLREALAQAASRTAIDDPRMPPVKPRELPHLTLDISILHSFRTLPPTANRRRQGIELGKHGLRIRWQKQAGLLLPSVPLEQGWDVDAFLSQLCRKAGLPTEAWRNPQAELVRFESLSWRFPLQDCEPQLATTPALLRAEEITVLQRHAQQNVYAQMIGATPACYAPQGPDGNVPGVALVVRCGDRSLSLQQLQLRGSVPLQASLYTATQRAAQALLKMNARPASLDDVQTEVVVFHDVAMHGSTTRPQLDGIRMQHEALLVLDRNRCGWARRPGSLPAEALEEAKQLAGLRPYETAHCFSVLASASSPSLAGGSAPLPQDTAAPRTPAVAGKFYPGEAAAMESELNALFHADAPRQPRRCHAVMAPHAGWIYSGSIAAETMRQTVIPQRVLVIGPKHTRHGVDFAIAPHASWSFPGGGIAADRALAEQLAADVPYWELDAAAHAAEHCIEVELPLLAKLRSDVLVTGVALAGGDGAMAMEMAKALAASLSKLPELPLLLISSDMNHFATEVENRRRDRMALDAMLTGDGNRLLDTCRQNEISMCGVFPAAIVMQTLRQLGLRPQWLETSYATSADVSGDATRVVGYAGVLAVAAEASGAS